MIKLGFWDVLPNRRNHGYVDLDEVITQYRISKLSPKKSDILNITGYTTLYAYPICLFWGWDWDHQSYSREGSGFLGIVGRIVCFFRKMFDSCWVGMSWNMFDVHWYFSLWQVCVLDMRTMQRNSRWWFEIFFIFTPNPDEDDPIWLFFQMGWNHHLELFACRVQIDLGQELADLRQVRTDLENRRKWWF